MSPKNDCICPNVKCGADLKEAGITMVKKVYVSVTSQNGDWDFGNRKAIYYSAYCKECKKEIKDKAILDELREGWREVAHL